jgi:cytochrome c biogenesis protein CcmG/thiol:disulfide interchange protein DsbE
MPFSRLLFVVVCAIFLVGLKVGDKPPEFLLYDLNDKLVSLYQLKGNIVFISFWSDSCHKNGTPLIDDLIYDKYKGRGLAILAINAGQPKKVVEAFLKGKNVSYPILLDQRFGAVKQYGVTSLPMYFILDREGIVRNRILGEVEIAYLEKILENLL